MDEYTHQMEARGLAKHYDFERHQFVVPWRERELLTQQFKALCQHLPVGVKLPSLKVDWENATPLDRRITPLTFVRRENGPYFRVSKGEAVPLLPQGRGALGILLRAVADLRKIGEEEQAKSLKLYIHKALQSEDTP